MRKLQFVWDPVKAKANESKHGVLFEEARTVFFDENATEFYDDEHAEWEDRFLRPEVPRYVKPPHVNCICIA